MGLTDYTQPTSKYSYETVLLQFFWWSTPIVHLFNVTELIIMRLDVWDCGSWFKSGCPFCNVQGLGLRPTCLGVLLPRHSNPLSQCVPFIERLTTQENWPIAMVCSDKDWVLSILLTSLFSHLTSIYKGATMECQAMKVRCQGKASHMPEPQQEQHLS